MGENLKVRGFPISDRDLELITKCTGTLTIERKNELNEDIVRYYINSTKEVVAGLKALVPSLVGLKGLHLNSPLDTSMKYKAL